jgi:hypothetical protein
MMTNKLILRSGMEHQVFQSDPFTSQKQFHSNQFPQNELSYFVKVSFSPMIVAKIRDVN